jgi:hypothetical protein
VAACHREKQRGEKTIERGGTGPGAKPGSVMGDNSSAGSMMRQSSPSFAFRKYPRAWRGAIWPDLGTRARFVSADLSPEAGPSYVLQRTFPEPTPPWACHQVPMKLKAWADTPPAKLPRPPGMIGEEGSHIECMPIMRSEDVAKVRGPGNQRVGIWSD